MNFRLVLTFLLGGLVAAYLASGVGRAATPDYRGAYVTSRNVHDAQDGERTGPLVLPAASGVFLRIAWDEIEPERGRFNWQTFDRIIVPAIKANKSLSIGVIAGSYAPAWIGTQGGVSSITLTTPESQCRTGRFYLPWDGRYQQAYLDLMKGLKLHLEALGGYSNLKIVKISFIAQHTLELRLPARRGGERDGCQVDDASELWIKAGYRPSLVLAAYRHIVDVMAREIFPGKLLSQATQRGIPFPDIGENSQLAPNGTADISLLNNLIASCINVADHRCAIQNQSLQSVGPVGDRVVAAHSKGAIIGWQTAINKGRARCQLGQADSVQTRARFVPRVPCTSQLYAAVLQRALDAGATYLELWPEDVQQFPEVVSAVDQKLRSAK